MTDLQHSTASPDVPLYLLFRDERSVQWSFDRSELERTLATARADGGTYAHDDLVNFSVSSELADKLRPLSCPEPHMPPRWEAVQSSQIAAAQQRERSRIRSPVHPPRPGGLRVYLTFLDDGTCRWSPSGNNLNSVIGRRPEFFLCPALRVAVTPEEHSSLYGLFKWTCDNF